MTRLLWACLFACVLAVTVQASWFDFEQITIDNTVGGKSLTLAKIPSSLMHARCRIRTAEISYLTVDPAKTAVTASIGTLLEPGDVFYIFGREEALNLRMIRTGATSGQVDCEYKYSAAP